MTTFLISYDLADPQQNKHAIASAIMMLGQSWARPLEQTWYIRSEVEDRDIETVLSGLLGDEDGLLVQAVQTNVVLANTTLRWFRQRRAVAEGTSANVVTFPHIQEKPHNPADPADPVVEFELAEAS
jgi:hypothetical protein